ncbi:MAG: hypothetical protein JWO53_772 [Chlamydiia bacterium]|nr:hypothetical protein [Chlamydiia bacterium]
MKTKMMMMTLFKKKYVFLPLLLSTCFCGLLPAASLAEKRLSLSGNEGPRNNESFKSTIRSMNQEILKKKQELLKFNTESNALYAQAIAEKKDEVFINELFSTRFKLAEKIKGEITTLEEKWKDLSKNLIDQEDEGLWHQPDTTIGQLVVDYGSVDNIYLMPPEIAGMKIHISSQLTVPRASWNEMLELILASYGIGSKQLNTFTRQLFFMRLNQSSPSAICDNPQELITMAPESRVCFVVAPPPTETKRIYQFLEKFVPQEQMSFQMIGSNIVIVGITKEIQELLKIYNFLLSPKQSHEYRLISLQKAHSEEVAQILQSLFEGEASRSFGEPSGGKHMPAFGAEGGSSGFRIITMKHPSQSLFLLGKREQIEKAVQIIQDIETRIGEVQEKTVYWYPCKHSEAEELAKVLSQVYCKMESIPQAFANTAKDKPFHRKQPRDPSNSAAGEQEILDSTGFVTPPIVGPQWIGAGGGAVKKKNFELHENFIVDPKTNSIVMVVEAYLLEKIKDLVKMLDVPKKMVQIDVLLFEKKITDTNNFGMNLLRLGNVASDKHSTNYAWNNISKKSPMAGILQFSLSRHGGGFIPPYDIAFNFLLTQQDVQINANPSVTTVNQTPAKIAIVDEISINTGVIEVNATNDTRFKNSFSRAQYGITIQITPTIHAKADGLDETNEPKFITLQTEVDFDTPINNNNDRPDVIKRNIKNEVRIADGETIILGGLRRKNAASEQHSIPFFGELPGVGKFFSTTSLTDTSTEMFIFITPKIVPDPSDEFHLMRRQELVRRPGDIPEFLEEVELAKKEEKKQLFERSLKLLFGKADITNTSPQIQ